MLLHGFQDLDTAISGNDVSNFVDTSPHVQISDTNYIL